MHCSFALASRLSADHTVVPEPNLVVPDHLPLSSSVVEMATHAVKEACLGEFMAAVQVHDAASMSRKAHVPCDKLVDEGVCSLRMCSPCAGTSRTPVRRCRAPVRIDPLIVIGVFAPIRVLTLSCVRSRNASGCYYRVPSFSPSLHPYSAHQHLFPLLTFTQTPLTHGVIV